MLSKLAGVASVAGSFIGLELKILMRRQGGVETRMSKALVPKFGGGEQGLWRRNMQRVQVAGAVTSEHLRSSG